MNRHPAGTSVGGRFASVAASEVPDDLADEHLSPDPDSADRRIAARAHNSLRMRMRAVVPSAATIDADEATAADSQGRPIPLDVHTRARLRARLDGLSGVVDVSDPAEVEEKRFLIEQERS